VIEPAFAELVPATSITAACRLLGRSKATHYRRQRPKQPRPRAPRSTPPNALTQAERAAVLTSPRFIDKSVAQTWATLLDEDVYLASMSTMHRILRAAGQAGERRRQASHPPRQRPELVACRPAEVWSWDIERHEAP
jgi:putative transposase